MLVDRLALGWRLESPLATATISIDDAELDRLCEVLRHVYGPQELAKIIWDRNRKNDARYFSVGHLTPGDLRRSQNWLGPSGCTVRRVLLLANGCLHRLLQQ